jgi:hypothetical protein
LLDIAEEYINSFRPFLMDVIFAWSKGASFGEVCGMTEIFEGSTIRWVSGRGGAGLRGAVLGWAGLGGMQCVRGVVWEARGASLPGVGVFEGSFIRWV